MNRTPTIFSYVHAFFAGPWVQSWHSELLTGILVTTYSLKRWSISTNKPSCRRARRISDISHLNPLLFLRNILVDQLLKLQKLGVMAAAAQCHMEQSKNSICMAWLLVWLHTVCITNFLLEYCTKSAVKLQQILPKWFEYVRIIESSMQFSQGQPRYAQCWPSIRSSQLNDQHVLCLCLGWACHIFAAHKYKTELSILKIVGGDGEEKQLNYKYYK